MIKLILFIGGIETQEYFSLQMEKAFKEMGHETFLFDLREEGESFPLLCHFIEKGNTCMVTFNFHGLNHEECFYQNNRIFWEEWEVPCFNIVLDHPFYYHKYLNEVPPLYIHISIDCGHERYMKYFYPNIKLGPFLPLAGTEIANKPFEERSKNLVITGNYTPPKNFEHYITRLDDEYTKFYWGIINDLIAHPDLDMDQTFVKHLTREIPDIDNNDLKKCMENMIFIDLYVRFYFRGLVVRTLVDNGIPITAYGGGWELLECRGKKNLLIGGGQDSYGCLEAIADSKISLNVMPWFKDGAHDRVFNSMLNGALSLSDDSIWMKENLIADKEIVYYSLSEIDKVPSIVDNLLSHPQKIMELARNGYQKAKKFHSWESRAKALSEYICKYFTTLPPVL